MPRRLLPLLLLAVSLAAPAVAQAELQHFAVPSDRAEKSTPEQTLRKARAVVNGRGAEGGRELTPLLKTLALQLPQLEGSDRARARRLLARPAAGEGNGNEIQYTVPEQAPLCSAHFCVHWVATSDDAPPLADSDSSGTPDYVEFTSAVFENVYANENGRLGWLPPVPDGVRGCPPPVDPGCANHTDVYLADVGGQGIFGYAGPDPGQTSLHQVAYLVMDNDYSAAQFPRYQGDPTMPLEVTAAHEYNHVLQFAYDTAQDTWMFEATAVWMEEEVYPELDDYLQYIAPWAQLSFVPLTYFNINRSDDPINVKVYGDAVWNHWITARHGPTAVRNAWERSLTSTPKSFAPGAYDGALRARGSSFFDSFTRFAVDTAEWRAANTAFPQGPSYPDMERVRDTNTNRAILLEVNRGGAGGKLPHTTFGLVEVAPLSVPRVKLVVNTPRGVQAAIALVGRTGPELGGTATVALKQVPRGGVGTVTMANPEQFDRLTAVLVNGDGRTTGRFSRTLQDWEWVGDGASVAVRLSDDFKPPRIKRRSPSTDERDVPRNDRVKVSFSEAVENVGSSTVRLTGPGGKRVSARIVSSGKGRRLEIRPRRRLRAKSRYVVRLSADIVDRGGNSLPRSVRKWSFRTER
jgi:hypothetical protein